jgi:hypothetical protein
MSEAGVISNESAQVSIIIPTIMNLEILLEF